MSKVTIRGMDMPEGCKDCKFCHLGHYRLYDSQETHEIIGCHASSRCFYDSYSDDEKPKLTVRQDFCPLEEI